MTPSFCETATAASGATAVIAQDAQTHLCARAPASEKTVVEMGTKRRRGLGRFVQGETRCHFWLAPPAHSHNDREKKKKKPQLSC